MDALLHPAPESSVVEGPGGESATLSAERLERIERLLGSAGPPGDGGRAQLGELLQMHAALRQAVEADLARVVDGFPGQAAAASRHLLDAGGKRLRPVLAMLACAALGGQVSRALPAALAVELLHTGSLLHDDVVDRGELRRGRPAARCVFGDPTAVLAGDWCIFAALDAIVSLHDSAALDRAMTVARMLTEAELWQLERRGQVLHLGVDDYLRLIEQKTGSLFGLAAYTGARCATASIEQSELLWRFGLRLGMAFQVVDDLLDLCGEPAHTGKSVGTDLAQGTITLPLILAVQERAEIGELLLATTEAQRRELGAPEVQRRAEAVAHAVAGTRAIALTRERAAQLTTEAQALAAELPPSPCRAAFAQLSASLLERAS